MRKSCGNMTNGWRFFDKCDCLYYYYYYYYYCCCCCCCCCFLPFMLLSWVASLLWLFNVMSPLYRSDVWSTMAHSAKPPFFIYIHISVLIHTLSSNCKHKTIPKWLYSCSARHFGRPSLNEGGRRTWNWPSTVVCLPGLARQANGIAVPSK